MCTLMFTAALLTIAKIWKQPKCPSVVKWIKNMCYIYVAFWDNMDKPRGYYATWNTSDRERQILYEFTCMWSLKQNKTNKTKQKQTHRFKEQTGGCQREGG